jgi:hypothetical protein
MASGSGHPGCGHPLGGFGLFLSLDGFAGASPAIRWSAEGDFADMTDHPMVEANIIGRLHYLLQVPDRIDDIDNTAIR